MTIGENMFLGNERGHKYKINWNETNARAAELLKTVGLKEGPQTLIKDIGVGKQQRLPSAKALAKNAKLLILDEPTASLNGQIPGTVGSHPGTQEKGNDIHHHLS